MVYCHDFSQVSWTTFEASFNLHLANDFFVKTELVVCKDPLKLCTRNRSCYFHVFSMISVFAILLAHFS